MKNVCHGFRRNQSGFTLVELLIVIAIIGVLSAIIVPNVTGLTGIGQTEAASAEQVTVQTAMDAMMTKNSLKTVTVVSSASNNMASFPDSQHPLYPGYLRSAATSGSYTCSANGLVSQTQTNSTKTATPSSTTVAPTTTKPATITPTPTKSPTPSKTLAPYPTATAVTD
jgi:prepilin-type N-terminal cleavage/methylation domain-containing protein